MIGTGGNFGAGEGEGAASGIDLHSGEICDQSVCFPPQIREHLAALAFGGRRRLQRQLVAGVQ
jgi:hypothetical protein